MRGARRRLLAHPPDLTMTTLTDTETPVSLTDEPECQAEHTQSECTIHVVARKTVTCQGWSFNVCHASYTYNRDVMTAGYPCDRCHRACDECWRVVLI
jgi:hypothetical protein